MTKKEIAKEIGIWIVTAMLVLAFANAGIRKFLPHGGWTAFFHNVGYPDWFRIFIGVLEVAAAALLLVPRLARYGAIIVIVTMLGAFGTVLKMGWTRGMPQPLIALALALIVLAARWRPSPLPLSLRERGLG